MAALGFTPASSADVFCFESKSSITDSNTTLSGEEARVFYEGLIKDVQDETGRVSRVGHEHQIRQRPRAASRRQSRRIRSAERTSHRTESTAQRQMDGVTENERTGESSSSSAMSTILHGLRLLRCAHEGNIPELKDLLSKGVDINFQDSFLWTAMMCACWSGQRAAVQLLLQRGAAWVGVVDMQGRDARDLAQEAGHADVLEELMNFGGNARNTSQSQSRSRRPQWCGECRCEFTACRSSHVSSTVHQFSVQRPPPTPYYCLPPSSNSYRMMLRCGWKPGTGLGREGEGTKQPVPTVLKRDHTGLGYGQMKKAKVTHFQARDQDAVKPRFREKEQEKLRGSKEEFKRKERRDKIWERDFRTSFYL